MKSDSDPAQVLRDILKELARGDSTLDDRIEKDVRTLLYLHRIRGRFNKQTADTEAIRRFHRQLEEVSSFITDASAATLRCFSSTDRLWVLEDAVQDVIDDAKSASKRAPEQNKRGPRQQYAHEVVRAARRIYTSYTKKRSTRRTDAGTNLAYGPFHDFLQRLFPVLEVPGTVSGAMRSVELLEKRRSE